MFPEFISSIANYLKPLVLNRKNFANSNVLIIPLLDRPCELIASRRIHISIFEQRSQLFQILFTDFWIPMLFSVASYSIILELSVLLERAEIVLFISDTKFQHK